MRQITLSIFFIAIHTAQSTLNSCFVNPNVTQCLTQTGCVWCYSGSIRSRDGLTSKTGDFCWSGHFLSLNSSNGDILQCSPGMLASVCLLPDATYIVMPVLIVLGCCIYALCKRRKRVRTHTIFFEHRASERTSINHRRTQEYTINHSVPHYMAIPPQDGYLLDKSGYVTV
ncbi:hypothetical protein PROFUN_13249 [Planoprotostelium fungivorum]|nr:hypothetical protein PROFUN_13249 [Planoprotostelium fungivorum]